MPRLHEENSEPKPVFDFSTYSHKQARENDLDGIRFRRLREMLDDYHSYATEEAFERALDEYQALMDRLNEALCRLLIVVPREWLIENAPADLDWKQIESLNWLRADKYGALYDAMAEARQPENVSKNSEKR